MTGRPYQRRDRMNINNELPWDNRAQGIQVLSGLRQLRDDQPCYEEIQYWGGDDTMISYFDTGCQTTTYNVVQWMSCNTVGVGYCRWMVYNTAGACHYVATVFSLPLNQLFNNEI